MHTYDQVSVSGQFSPCLSRMYGWSPYGNQVYASLFGCSEEGLKVKDSLGGEAALLALQEGPVCIEGDSINANCLDLLEDVEPETRHWEPKMRSYVSKRYILSPV